MRRKFCFVWLKQLCHFSYFYLKGKFFVCRNIFVILASSNSGKFFLQGVDAKFVLSHFKQEWIQYRSILSFKVISVIEFPFSEKKKQCRKKCLVTLYFFETVRKNLLKGENIFLSKETVVDDCMRLFFGANYGTWRSL